MIFEETVKPRLSDFDLNGKISYETILKILEDAGAHHSEHAGDSILFREAGDLVWLLTEWHVEIVSDIYKRTPLHIKTWVSGKPNSLFFFRSYIVENPAGEVLVRAMQKFVLVDISTKQILRISEDLYESFAPEEYTSLENLPRIRPISEYETNTTLRIHSEDLDYNRHVHNTRYLGLCLNLLSEQGITEPMISEIHYTCKSETHIEDEPKAKFSIKENSAHIMLYDEDRTFMICDLIFR